MKSTKYLPTYLLTETRLFFPASLVNMHIGTQFSRCSPNYYVYEALCQTLEIAVK